MVKDRGGDHLPSPGMARGRECEVRNLSEVEEAVRTLAYLHRNFRQPQKEGGKISEESLEEELTRKNAELKRVRKFMRSRRAKDGVRAGISESFRGLLWGGGGRP